MYKINAIYFKKPASWFGLTSDRVSNKVSSNSFATSRPNFNASVRVEGCREPAPFCNTVVNLLFVTATTKAPTEQSSSALFGSIIQ